MQDFPVGRQAEGNVAELKDLVECKRQSKEGGSQQGQGKSKGGHDEEKEISKDDEDVMKRHDALPAEAGEEGDSSVFSILRKGREVGNDEIRKSKKSQREGDGKKAMRVPRLKDKGNGGDDIGKVDGEEEFAKAAIDETHGRKGVREDNEER